MPSPKKLLLVVCDHYAAELRAVVSADAYPEVEVRAFRSTCHTPGPNWKDIIDAIGTGAETMAVNVLGGHCLWSIAATPPELASVIFHRKPQCFELVAGPSLVAHFQREGAFLVTPGWLADWRRKMADWGLDERTASEFFAETASRVVLLDTGVDPDAETHLKTFCAFIQRTGQGLVVGTDYLRMTVHDMIREHRVEQEARDRQRHISRLAAQASEYAMAMEFLKKLNAAETTESAVAILMDLFDQIMSPGRLTACYRDKDGKDRLRCKHDPEPGVLERLKGVGDSPMPVPAATGFRMPIHMRASLLAVIEVEAVAFPEHLHHYVNLAMTISGLCALGLENATKYEQLDEARKDLARSERRYRELFSHMSDGVAIYRRSGDGFSVVDMNAAGRRIHGIGEGDRLAGERLGDVLPGILDTELPECLDQAEKVGAPKQIPEFFFRDDRGGRWLSADVYRLPTAEVVTIFRDLTREKQAAEMRRTLEMQLRESRKLEAIGTLSGGIAHNFNNILGIIIGNMELAVDFIPPDHPAYDNMMEIQSAGMRAANLVTQLLNYSQSTEIEAKPVRMKPLIHEFTAWLRETAPGNIEIRAVLPESDLRVSGDSAQIREALKNLCTNACQAMKGGGMLTVAVSRQMLDASSAVAYPELKPGRHVRITVTDTGHGIKQAYLSRIFDPYFSTRDVGEGLGMGLSVVHGIMRRHNGAVTVESEPGKTVFTLLFREFGQEDDAATV